MTVEQMVREVLRDHIRSVDTICWGIMQLFQVDVSNDDVKSALERLESQGQAERVQLGDDSVWWRGYLV